MENKGKNIQIPQNIKLAKRLTKRGKYLLKTKEKIKNPSEKGASASV